MAVTALAIFCAFKPCIITLAIFFLTQRFFTGTFPGGHIGRHSLKIVRLPVIDNTFGPIDLFFISESITATNAHTVLIAHLALGEALAVQLEAIDFGALAAWVGQLPRRQI